MVVGFVQEDMLCSGLSSSRKDPADLVDRMARRMRHKHHPGLSGTSRGRGSSSSGKSSLGAEESVGGDSKWLFSDGAATDISFGDDAEAATSQTERENASLEAFMCDDDLMALLNDD
jgi:hypothetical protein